MLRWIVVLAGLGIPVMSMPEVAWNDPGDTVHSPLEEGFYQVGEAESSTRGRPLLHVIEEKY